MSEFQIKAIQNFKNEVQALFFKNNPSKYSSQLLENVSSSTPQTISDKRLDNKSTPIKNSDNTFDDNHQETHLLTEQGNSLTPIIKQSDQIQAEEDNENSSIEKIAKSNTTVTNSILINGKRYYRKFIFSLRPKIVFKVSKKKILNLFKLCVKVIDTSEEKVKQIDTFQSTLMSINFPTA